MAKMIKELLSKESPLWPIVRYIVLGLLVVWGLSTGYDEGWVEHADVPVLLKIVAGFGVYDVAKTITTKAVEKKNEQA